MRLKEVKASVGKTINTGDYNSIRVDGAVTIEVQADEDGDMAMSECIRLAHKMMNDQLKKLESQD